MATIKMMQGDSYAIFVNLKIDGNPLTPNMVSEVEITIGDSLRKLYSAGGVKYDTSLLQWYISPTQEETLAMEPNGYDVQARIKLKNGQNSSVKGVSVGRVVIVDAQSEEVI